MGDISLPSGENENSWLKKNTLDCAVISKINNHMETRHAGFLSWCAACVRRRGQAESNSGDGHWAVEDSSKIQVL